MSEPKLCPFQRHDCIVRNYGNEPIAVSQSDIQPFNPCLQDKCATWRTTRNPSHGETGFHEDKEATGYCGLAGKP